MSYEAVMLDQLASEYRNEDIDDEATQAEVLDQTETPVRDEFKPFSEECPVLGPQISPNAPRTHFAPPELENYGLPVAGVPEVEAAAKLDEARDARATTNYRSLDGGGPSGPVMILAFVGLVLATIAGVGFGMRVGLGGDGASIDRAAQVGTNARDLILGSPPSLGQTPIPQRQVKKVIQEGDAIWRMARDYGLQVDEILAVNPGLSSYEVLSVGADIIIPTGDTLDTLAAQPAAPPPAAPALTGFRPPVEGACLPGSDGLMPNAARGYRYGVHEGVDFYAGYICGAAVGAGTPVHVAKSGTVSLALHDYRNLTSEEWQGVLSRSQRSLSTSADDLHVLRGRQVWIDHGEGISTRYAHLSEIAAGLEVGDRVEAGQVIAFVGNSGTPESITNPAGEMHLHFELRVGGSFLGAGLPPGEVRRLYELAFSP